MPLSKARDRERKRLAKFQPNSNLKIPLKFQPNTLKKQKQEELQAMIHTMEDKKPAQPKIDYSLPWYNAEIHTTGDTVLQRDPKTGKIQEVTL